MMTASGQCRSWQCGGIAVQRPGSSRQLGGGESWVSEERRALFAWIVHVVFGEEEGKQRTPLESWRLWVAEKSR